MNPRTLLPLALGLAAFAAPAAHAAKPLPQQATFKVELKGVQTTEWAIAHKGAGAAACDMDQFGSGKETIRFSAKPGKMIAIQGAGTPTFFPAKKPVGLYSTALRGKISRQGTLTTEPLPAGANCPGGGTPTAPPTPDCGTRSIQGLTVKPQYEYDTDLLILEQDGEAVDPFKHCPALSNWPYLLPQNTDGSDVGQRLPFKDLFEQGKNIVIATGKNKVQDDDSVSITKIRWELSFTRVKNADPNGA